MKILCVDDDPVVRTLYLKRLSKMLPDDDITVVSSRKEAIREIEQHYYEVIFTDLVMPGLSGFDVLKYTLESSMTTEVIIVTGAASVDSAIDTLQHGAHDYIEKPIDMPLLIEKLESIRNYQKMVIDGENLQMAKEAADSGAEEELKILEVRIHEMLTAINTVLKSFDTMGENVTSREIREAVKVIEVYRWQDQ